MKAKFTKLSPGSHYVFMGEAANYQTFVADFFVMAAWHRDPDVAIYVNHLAKHGETFPTDERFQTARWMLEQEPDCIVVTSVVRPKLVPIADYRHHDAVFIESSATHSCYVVELKLGDDVGYWPAHYREFLPCEKPPNPHQVHGW
jgi:hypothetical protein